MSGALRVAVLSVVPSPYQRDLFEALAQRPEVALSVFYQERQPHDSPWPQQPLRSFERLLSGFYLRAGTIRSHVNWNLPGVEEFDVWIINAALTSLTAQWMMRVALAGRKWCFWGERLQGGNGGLRSWGQRSLASALTGATGIASIGSLARSDYEKRFPQARHATIPYHTRLEPFIEAASKRRSGSEVTFFFAGQMIRRKGIDVLLRAFDRLAGEGAPVRLLLAGRETTESATLLKALSPQARARVINEGFQPPEKLAELFARADVFVLPSRHDGWGVVINQALASGLPIIATEQVGAAVDYVTTGTNGVLLPGPYEDALYLAMEMFAQDPKLAVTWGQASLKRAAELTPEVGAQKWVEFLHTL